MTDTAELERLARPLIWDGSNGVGECGLAHYSWHGGALFRGSEDQETVEWYDTFDAAKAAAQSDYECRIRNALVPDLLAEVIALRAEVERLEARHDDDRRELDRLTSEGEALQARATAAEADAERLAKSLCRMLVPHEGIPIQAIALEKWADWAREAIAANTRRVNAKEGV